MNESTPPSVDGQSVPVNVQPPAPSTPTTATPPPASPSPAPPSQPAKKHGMMHSLLLFLVIIVVALAAAAGGYAYGKTKAPTTVVTKTVAIPKITVPQGATVISQCSPGKGALYALPKDIPTGPVYLVNQGKVIGLEFMVGKDALFSGTNYLNLPMFSQQYDHVNIGLLSQGHAGFPVPHYHVDVFTVPNSVASKITCT